jgi:hypothetical protein
MKFRNKHQLGPVTDEEETEVHRSLFYKTSIGDPVKVTLKKGLLNMPWF